VTSVAILAERLEGRALFLFGYLLHKIPVGFRFHQPRKILLQIVWPNYCDPSLFVWTLVDKFGSIRKFAVDLEDDSRNRGVHVGDCFDGFHRAKTLHLGHFGSDLRKIDVDYLVQRILRIVSDTYSTISTLYVNPLVFFRVIILGRNLKFPLQGLKHGISRQSDVPYNSLVSNIHQSSS